ncbi:cupin domain-containing protein [Streptomyces sp. B3I8]|uniref:cupin domain-containing protein n=1 Tax=Streptomyces sp. B3I8 TaxID=3042303 RepID=UPI00278567EF|nr:hypothetical protein [Streptomyces sp. B3I8]MDQ0784646.1 hypothetical protein [Streptomyces sp. B3I8]
MARSFESCVEEMENAVRASGLNLRDRVTTSRDPGVRKALEMLYVEDVPTGFRKWQLPVHLNGPSLDFITVGEPGARVGDHSHDGDGIRYVMSGSITVNGNELTSGDWMFIPAGVDYSFEVGPYGALMSSKYLCCC